MKALLGEFDNYVNDHIDIALSVTTELKKALSSPVADLLVALIPGDLDSLIRERLVKGLDIAVKALTVAENCKQCTTTEDSLRCFVGQLKQLDPNLQDAVLQKLASLLSFHMDGQRMKQHMYDLYTQAKYALGK